ncbi:hypothetical protein CTAYLR_003024 [Chrysophaeum taylorii]|uniref:Cwf15/Cwc15 cell cycle control protein n=1 Tax=Chrysophaeum taylorii TaxID=2483200 RepID=A0AAD7U794_9STRA|nr:hypothetical protein CTAYLR_003024 [Chrysophaeum taylorii]
MTTAHRPTWTAARHEAAEHGNWTSGGVRSMQMPARDMPSHLTMKYRRGSQLPAAFDKEAAKGEADDREDAARLLVLGAPVAKVDPKPQLLLTAEPVGAAAYDDADESDESEIDEESDDEDDEVALQLELEKIKREREEERAKKEAQAAADAKAVRDAEALATNPLLNQPNGAVKRKWNDDVVFRNQARGVKEPKKQFINDTIRNDFHKRFLAKYVH